MKSKPKRVARNRNTRNVSAPSTSSLLMPYSGPKLSAQGQGVRITNREYFADVIGNAARYTNYRYEINPGLPQFTWLSGVASSWEKYRFNKLRFLYRTESNSGTSGYVAMAIDMDAADTPAPSKAELLSYKNSESNAPWISFAISMPSDKETRYIRSTPLGTNLDIKTYDVGTFQYAVGGTPGEILGELWIEYDVYLSIPQRSRLQPQDYATEWYTDTVQTSINGSALVEKTANLKTVDKTAAFEQTVDPSYPGGGGLSMLARRAGNYIINSSLTNVVTGEVDPLRAVRIELQKNGTMVTPTVFGRNDVSNMTNSTWQIPVAPGDVLKFAKFAWDTSKTPYSQRNALIRIAPFSATS